MILNKSHRNWVICFVVSLSMGLLAGVLKPDFFVDPSPVGPEWNHMSSIRGVDRSKVARGAHLFDNHLRIVAHDGIASDRLAPASDQLIDRFSISLAEHSDVLQLNIGGGSGHILLIRPGGIATDPDMLDWEVTLEREFQFEMTPDSIQINGGRWQVSTPVGFGTVELRAVDGVARIESAHFESNGQTVLSLQRDVSVPSPLTFIVFSVFGLLVGIGLVRRLHLGLSVSKWITASFFASIPFIPLFVADDTWFHWTEKLLIVTPHPWVISWIVMVIAMIPTLFSVAVLGVNPIRLRRRSAVKWRHVTWYAWWFLSGLTTVWYWTLDYPAWGVVSVVFFLSLTPMTAARLRLGDAWPLWDIPTLLMLLLLADYGGFWLATIWRLFLWLRLLSKLISIGRRPTADALFLLLMCILVSAELALQKGIFGSQDAGNGNSSLNRISDLNNISNWSGRCGSVNAVETKYLVFVGGSSTGGAYQYGLDQSQFYPAFVHQLICNRLEADQALYTKSYAGADRNTHTIALQIEDMVSQSTPDVLAVYTGVNDVLNRQSTETAAQRAAKDRKKSEVNWVDWTSHSSMMRLLSLAIRPAPQSSRTVPEVPVSDARLNLERIIAAVRPGHTLLMTELTLSGMRSELKAYQSMQQEISMQHATATHIDLDAKIPTDVFDPLLMDINHMLPEGAQYLASTLAEPLYNHLFSAKSPLD